MRHLREEGVFISCEVPHMRMARHDEQPQGHYLHAKDNGIDVCATREKLLQDHAEFFATLTAREEQLLFKRK